MLKLGVFRLFSSAVENVRFNLIVSEAFLLFSHGLSQFGRWKAPFYILAVLVYNSLGYRYVITCLCTPLTLLLSLNTVEEA